MNVVGVKKCDGTSKDGYQFDGYNIYYTDQMLDSEKQLGCYAARFYIPSHKVDKPFSLVGHDINVIYNRFGKAEAIEVIA